MLYEVLDVRPGAMLDMAVLVENAASPEAAAKQVLGLDLSRSGSAADLAAQVFWQTASQTSKSMIQLFSRHLVSKAPFVESPFDVD